MSIGRRKFLQIGAASAATTVGACSPPPLVCTPRAEVRTPTAFDGRIEHFIVLMLENRSYDQMLGALSGPEDDGVADGARLAYEDRSGSPAWVSVRHGAPPDGFSPDPGHNFRAVSAQIHGRGVDRPADMSGFVRRFTKDHPSVSEREIQEYATIYADGRLPVLQGLAKEYGVCSHWFCSLPSSTTPNRMFTHAGTSRGATRQGAYYSRIAGGMVFDRLPKKDWRVYFHDVPHLWLTGDSWTHTCAGQFHYVREFEKDVRSDKLAAYTFIEPQHIVPPWNSQHPSAGVSHGEKLIARIYNALVSNPCVFEKSLLLIVYDEHGGFHDHVVPPGHAGWNDAYPGIVHDVVAPDEVVGDFDGPDQGYAFTTLGPRVPAVVVSPWIEPRSVFGWKAADPTKRVTFDHTSILSTVGRMTGTWVDSKRARAATTLEVALNRASPRKDYPTTIAFDQRHYPRRGILRETLTPEERTDQAGACEGVAGDLRAAFQEQCGKSSPEALVEHFRRVAAVRDA